MCQMSITYYTWVAPFNKIDTTSIKQWMNMDDTPFVDLIHRESYRGYYHRYFDYVGVKNWREPNSKFYNKALKILAAKAKNDEVPDAPVKDKDIISESFALYVSDYILKRFLKILKFLAYNYMMSTHHVDNIPYDFDKKLEKKLKKISITDTPATFKSLLDFIVEQGRANGLFRMF